jgi:hypothetical protein
MPFHLNINTNNIRRENLAKQILLTKVGGSEMEHLRTGPPFSCISLDGNVFSSFFRQREIDEESNPSGFIFFQVFLNYL